MNSPGPFAFMLMGAMVYLTASNHWIRWVAGTVGFASFVLSLVRSAWGGWAIAMIVILVKANNSTRMRIASSAFVLATISIPIIMIGPAAERIQLRFQTLSNLGNDQSYAARNDFYEKFAKIALSDVTGEGLGATGTSTKLSTNTGQLGQYGNFDSGLMNVPFVLGWPGTLLYMSGLVWLMLRVSRSFVRLSGDQFATANIAIAVAVVAMLLFTNSLTGTSGLLLYGSIFSILSGASQRCCLDDQAKLIEDDK
jgi:hypothetical protein